MLQQQSRELLSRFHGLFCFLWRKGIARFVLRKNINSQVRHSQSLGLGTRGALEMVVDEQHRREAIL